MDNWNDLFYSNMDFLRIWVLVLIVFILGVFIGSFFNVVIYWIFVGLFIFWFLFCCFKCYSWLKFIENVFIFGWLWLCGCCGYCGSFIFICYLVVELIIVLLFLVVFGKFGIIIFILGYWVFFSWLLVLFMIDLDIMILFNFFI